MLSILKKIFFALRKKQNKTAWQGGRFKFDGRKTTNVNVKESQYLPAFVLCGIKAQIM